MKPKPSEFSLRKQAKRPISMITAYDFPAARLLDECGVDIVLLGDSLGTTVLGYESITQVTMNDIMHHLRAVVRGAHSSFILGDMPYGSIATPDLARGNAALMRSAGADAVKMEGGREIVPQVRAVTLQGIAVCAHIGFMPQTGGRPGIVGKTFDQARALIDAALALQEAGAFMIVLELIPHELAAEITRLLSIPTIGIGAGKSCDGQVQVFHDLLGLSPRIFRHVKDFAGGRQLFTKAILHYVADVCSGAFPAESNASAMPHEALAQLKDWLKTKM